MNAEIVGHELSIKRLNRELLELQKRFFEYLISLEKLYDNYKHYNEHYKFKRALLSQITKLELLFLQKYKQLTCLLCMYYNEKSHYCHLKHEKIDPIQPPCEQARFFEIQVI